jgi:hypothetical protein
MNNKNFASFLDTIREDRNITREDLVKDIVSLRQYYRFIKGESTLKSDTILKLLQRIEFDRSFFYEYFERTSNREFQQLQEIYKYLYRDMIAEAYSAYKEIDPNDLVLGSNKKYYEFITQVLLSKQNKQSYDTSAKAILKLIDYPEILNKKFLTHLEKNCLVFSTNYLMVNKDYRIATLFYQVTKTEDENPWLIYEHLVPFRTLTAKCLGMTEEHEKAYEILQNAEEHFFVKGDYLPMINLYYYKAVEERKLYSDKRYKKSLQKVFHMLRIAENEGYEERYSKAIEKHFNLKESDLFIIKP